MKFEKGDIVKSQFETISVCGPGELNGTFSGVVIAQTKESIYKIGELRETWREEAFEKIPMSSKNDSVNKFEEGDCVINNTGILIVVSQFNNKNFSGIVLKSDHSGYNKGEFRSDWITGNFEKTQILDAKSLTKSLYETEKSAVSNIKKISEEITQLIHDNPYFINLERLGTLKTQIAENKVVNDFIACLRKQFNLQP